MNSFTFLQDLDSRRSPNQNMDLTIHWMVSHIFYPPSSYVDWTLQKYLWVCVGSSQSYVFLKDPTRTQIGYLTDKETQPSNIIIMIRLLQCWNLLSKE